MIEISGVRSVPVIVVCEQVMVGFDAARLEQALNCMKQRTPVYAALDVDPSFEVWPGMP